MNQPTPTERSHYAKPTGRRIIAVPWEQMEGRPLPVLLLERQDRDGHAATVAVLADPEGNGPGHLDHNL
jgi:hypothetical protein